jgi:hypothetical protein
MTPQHILQDWIASAVQAGKPLNDLLHLVNEPELVGLPNAVEEIRSEYARCKKLFDERRAEHLKAAEEWKQRQAEMPTPTATVYVAQRTKARADNPTVRRRRFRRETYVISADPTAIRDGEVWKRIPEAPDYSFSNYHQIKRTRAVKGSPAGTVIVPGFGKKKHTRWKLVVGKGKRQNFYAFKLAQDLGFVVSDED